MKITLASPSLFFIEKSIVFDDSDKACNAEQSGLTKEKVKGLKALL